MKNILTVIGMSLLGVMVVYVNMAVINLTFDISKCTEGSRVSLSIWGTFMGLVGAYFGWAINPASKSK